MKQSLGKYVTLFLLLAASLWSKENYQWHSSVSQTDAYVNEAIFLESTCQFSDDGALYVIEFTPRDNDNYEIKLLKEDEKIVNGRRLNLYEFVIFPKHEGEFELNLEALMRKTTKESIENTVIGRDNVEDTDFTDKSARVLHETIHVKKALNPIIGEFDLKVVLDKTEVTAYEPTHLKITISGKGDLEKIPPFTLDIENTKIFSEAPQRELRLSQHGYEGVMQQEFAIVGTHDFVIPEIRFEYFDLEDEKEKLLLQKPLPVSVAKGVDKAILLDETTPDVWSFPWEYSYYLLTFLIGVLFGKYVHFKPKKSRISNVLKSKISESRSKNALAILLVISEEERFEEVIAKLEDDDYTLAQAKKELLDNICH